MRLPRQSTSIRSASKKIDSERALIRTFRRHREFLRPIPQRGGKFVGRQIVPYHFHCGDGFLKGNQCGGRDNFQRERRRIADLKVTYGPARNRFGRLARRALALSGDARLRTIRASSDTVPGIVVDRWPPWAGVFRAKRPCSRLRAGIDVSQTPAC